MRKLKRARKSTKYKRIDWEEASDIYSRVSYLVKKIDLDWVNIEKIKCFRSSYANTRAYARIWGLSRIWQLALDCQPIYVIEVISEKFDKLNAHQQDKVLLHELAHIPKNFSGALVAHTRRVISSFYTKLKQMEKEYESSNNSR
jgi:predicted metallopeptidase